MGDYWSITILQNKTVGICKAIKAIILEFMVKSGEHANGWETGMIPEGCAVKESMKE